MKTEITIKSDLFSAYSNEESNINLGRFGKKLGEFVTKTLEKNHIIISNFYPTDYSYEIRIDMYEFPIYIQVGNIDGEDDVFIISIEPKKEFVRKWFKKITTIDAVTKIYNSVLIAFQKNEDISILEN